MARSAPLFQVWRIVLIIVSRSSCSIMYKVYHGSYDRSIGLIATTVSFSFFTFSSVLARSKEDKGKLENLLTAFWFSELICFIFQRYVNTIRGPQTALHPTELILLLSCFPTGLQLMCAKFQLDQSPCLQSQTIELRANLWCQQRQCFRTAGCSVHFKKQWIALERCQG